MSERDETRTLDWGEPSPSRGAGATFVTLGGAPDGEIGDAPSAPLALPPRYTRLELLGEGGMGEVWRVEDHELNRTVAMKILRAPLLNASRGLARFREEAQVAAQLQHPGIVPVHDLGTLPDGRIWFTMKEVRGRTLEVLLQEVHQAWRLGRPATASGFTFRRMIDAFLRVCETVGYAHARGVVHRDLKPANIMVGDFGEVLVLDWGLARVLGDEAATVPEAERVRTSRSLDDATRTRFGAVTGTPAYMPPEQARGQLHRLGPWSDVYALGATLYDLLAERPPYLAAGVDAMLDLVMSAEPIRAPSEVADGPPVDEELDRICLRALAPRADDRYSDAGAMAADLAQWLDGARKRERALRVVAQAQALARDAARTEAEAAELEALAIRRLADVPPSAPEDEKWPGWDLEDQARALAQQASEQRTQATQLLRGALTHAPDLDEVHALLADELHRQHAALEGAGRHDEAQRVEAALRAHDRGRHAAYLRGEGAVSLVTDVPCEVELYRFEAVRRRLVPVFVRHLGVTPLDEVPLPMGSYLLKLRAPGRIEVSYPVRVGRLEHWDGVRPGGTAPFPIVLPRERELGEDERYVPAGWFWSSADLPQLTDPLPRRRLWCDAFAIGRFPVTNAEYLAFLNDLVARGREDDALSFVPRAPSARRGEPGAMVYGRDEEGRFLLGIDGDGHLWLPEMPAVNMSWDAALAYAAARGGRLPVELEWEKAARGVDERVYPWGNVLDPSWCHMRESWTERPGPRGVGEVEADVSVYGVRDLGGNVSDWTADPRPGGAELGDGAIVAPIPDEVAAPQRRVRGGAWASGAFYCRADLRRFQAVWTGLDYLGVRVARSFSRSA